MKNIYLGFPSTARCVPSIPQMTLLRPYLRKIRAALLAILCSSGMVTTWSGWGWGRRKQICTASHEQLQCMHLHRHLLSAGSGIHLKYRGCSKPPHRLGVKGRPWFVPFPRIRWGHRMSPKNCTPSSENLYRAFNSQEGKRKGSFLTLFLLGALPSSSLSSSLSSLSSNKPITFKSGFMWAIIITFAKKINNIKITNE